MWDPCHLPPWENWLAPTNGFLFTILHFPIRVTADPSRCPSHVLKLPEGLKGHRLGRGPLLELEDGVTGAEVDEQVYR